MPFPFSALCELLSHLERLKVRDPPLLPAKLSEESHYVVEKWFRSHRSVIDAQDTDGVALLSTLFPERRTDRVYSLKEAGLSKVIARCLCLSNAKTKDLQAWKTPGHGDLGACLEAIIKPHDCEPKPAPAVMIEEIDHALEELASQCRFSGPVIRTSFPSSSPRHEILESIYKRLNSKEAKWLTRLILKDFSPVILDAGMVLREFHFLLPGLLRFQDSFPAVISLLRGELSKYHAKPDLASQKLFKREAAKLLRPQVGIKVGRPPFIKARSMENCIKLAGTQKWSVERKYDGEYCEVHIDLCKGPECLQIYSKSGKDSTKDRWRVHTTIKECLRVGQDDCLFKKNCIVLGELVVWSDKENKILEFHKIRKFVSRSSVYIGTDEDSQRYPWEHLMIVFFDVLLVDDDIVMRKAHIERRRILSKLVCKKLGRAMNAERILVDFSSKNRAHDMLARQFAASLAGRMEGLVLKPSDMPYFAFDSDEAGGKRAYFVKAKGDYMPELGGARDVADFVIVGASYDPKQAQKSGIRHITHFTTFHLGCLTNEECLRFERMPVFEVVDSITQDQCIPTPVLQALNDMGRFRSKPFERAGNKLKSPVEYDLILDQNGCTKIDVVFTEPFVVEVLGSGFSKPSNKRYFMLRHPRILKLHLDRTWKDATTLNALAAQENEARSAPADGQSQEISQLTKKLLGKFQRKEALQCRPISTPRSGTTSSPVSTRRSPPSSRKSPLLVRIDTNELLPGETRGTSGGPSIISSSKQRRSSLATPPPSTEDMPNNVSTTSPPRRISAQNTTKQKRSRDVPDSPPIRKRERKETTKPESSLPLFDASNILKRSLTNPSSQLSSSFEKLRSKTRAPKLRRNQTLPNNPSTRSGVMDSCNNPNCLFSQAVAYLSPCVSGYKWVSESLLKWHGTERADKLLYWQRETMDLPPLGPLLSESPAWPGLQKIVFIEVNRAEASLSCVKEVQELKISEDVLFLDWRILEELKMIEEREQESSACGFGDEVFQRHYFGMTKWNEAHDKVEFLGRETLIPLDLD